MILELTESVSAARDEPFVSGFANRCLIRLQWDGRGAYINLSRLADASRVPS